jgi:peptidoglycan hydrolase CwlO-like protein
MAASRESQRNRHILREDVIVAVLLLLVLLPGCMNDVLSRAGFSSASIAGFEWELREAVQNTGAATKDVTDLQKRLDALGNQLNQVTQSPTASPQLKQEIATLSRDVLQAQSSTRDVESELQQNPAVQRSIIRRVDRRVLQTIESPQPTH